MSSLVSSGVCVTHGKASGERDQPGAKPLFCALAARGYETRLMSVRGRAQGGRGTMLDSRAWTEVIVAEPMTEAQLDEIGERAIAARSATPAPWVPFLETREGIGGESFIRVDGDSEIDSELGGFSLTLERLGCEP